MTSGESILHLSDLHFGGDHGFVTTTEQSAIPELPLDDIIVERTQSLSGCRIGMVVVSGDFITAGDANNFPYAKAFLERLLIGLGLEKKHVVMVPGNHDIWVQDDHPTRDYKAAVPYVSFMRDFYGANLTEIERLQAFRAPGNWRLNFLSLNSSRPRTKTTMEYGYVGKDRYELFLRRMRENNAGKNLRDLMHEKVLNFAVLHHHLIPGQLVCKPEIKRPVSLTLDAGELVSELQYSSFHFALHGHQHVPFIGNTSRARSPDGEWREIGFPLTVIGSGSSGAKTDRLSAEHPKNTFGIYTPQDNGLRIRMEEYNSTLKPRTFLDLVVPQE